MSAPSGLDVLEVDHHALRINGAVRVAPTPVELRFYVQVHRDQDVDEDALPAAATAAAPVKTVADAWINLRWNKEGKASSSVPERKPPTLEDVVTRNCARKVLLDHHKFTQPGHVAQDMMLDTMRTIYELRINTENVNASFACLKRGASLQGLLPRVSVVHQTLEEVTLRFDHPLMACHFLDRVTCAFDMSTAALIMAWWFKETERSASVDEWQFYGMNRARMLKLAKIMTTTPEGQFGRSPLTMHTRERWLWTCDPESLANAPPLLMFGLRVAMLMYRGVQIQKEVVAFNSPSVCHLLGLRARGILRKIDPKPHGDVPRLDNDYDQYKATALQYVHTLCSYALILEMAGLRGLSSRDSMYQWTTLERIVAPQHILQGADSAYIKIQKLRRGALLRPPPERADPAKKRYLDAAGNRQAKMTRFFGAKDVHETVQEK